ncbi:hypothetical protein BKA57DRAFT_457063, partial [Linnemannia elongata]
FFVCFVFGWTNIVRGDVLDTLLYGDFFGAWNSQMARSSRSNCVCNERISLAQVNTEASGMEKVLVLSSRVEGMQHGCCS